VCHGINSSRDLSPARALFPSLCSALLAELHITPHAALSILKQLRAPAAAPAETNGADGPPPEQKEEKSNGSAASAGVTASPAGAAGGSGGAPMTHATKADPLQCPSKAGAAAETDGSCSSVAAAPTRRLELQQTRAEGKG